MQLVVVESPAKAKTINKYLGKDFDVVASFGHVRDLPSKDGSVDPNADFAMRWEADARGAKQIREIAEKAKKADRIILATDPDREGEAISWHLLEALTAKKVLKDKVVDRVTFNAITKNAVIEAMNNPRQINQELVDAYLARRALDYLVGFTLSPVLWRKLPGARSAGRVQSVALRLVVERELEIEAFKSREYWTIAAHGTAAASSIETRLVALDGRKLDKFALAKEASARAAEAVVRAGRFAVASAEAKPLKKSPPPPFTTSTLQQEASRKLGFNAQRTMQVAQKLYEGVDIGGETVGLITYMRTDGVAMAEEAYHACRDVIADRFGAQYVPEKPRRYSSKAKNAQEAHEAIRPTDPRRHPSNLRLEPDMARLYELIWRRAVASQMEQAIVERTTIDFDADNGSATLRATGQVVLFDGYFALYQEGRDDEDDEDSRRLPALKVGDRLDVTDVKPEQHFTEPPPRYTEATLVKKMEELGIGRPSTYASILSVLRDRGYVEMDKNRFVPNDKGRIVTAFMENFFKRYVEYDFTANLEEQLDHVSAGDLDWKALLREFWEQFSASVAGVGDLRIGEVIDALDAALEPKLFAPREDGSDPRVCPSCSAGRLSLKLSKFGAFVGCSNYPDCRFTRQLSGDAGEDGAPEFKELGLDPASGLMVTLRAGRFGPYVQLGDGDKPKRGSIPKGWDPATLDLDRAMMLLSLPRTVGVHPEDGEPMLANIGRFGPYVQHLKTYASLSGVDEVFEVGINRAVALIAEKRAGGGRGGRGAAAQPLAELGAHPVSGATIKVMPGRYGPYVTDGSTNATVPKGADPAGLTLAEAAALLDARAALGPPKKGKKSASAKKPAAAKTPATAKAAASKATARKPAAKKPAAKKPA
ncbi:MAG: type I DNA topoisomerase [Hyphomonadaceae bacterium]|jgi:DNA topoisomerase-1|nr:type I DNA topoisomerase [Hyphomonadaceae bacterium]